MFSLTRHFYANGNLNDVIKCLNIMIVMFHPVDGRKVLNPGTKNKTKKCKRKPMITMIIKYHLI